MNIGIFDSGIGGLTLLHQAMIQLPEENYIYYADTAHVPYGIRTTEQVIGYVDEIIAFMVQHKCKAVVIACNTATAAAAELMREKYAIPIVGIEPAVKPAVEKSDGKRVMVIATPLTIRERKLQSLLHKIDDSHLVDLQPFPRLVTFAEERVFDTPEVRNYIEETLQPFDLTQYAEFVLGCTHFNFFKDIFDEVLPKGVQIIDGSRGTINQLCRVLEGQNKLEQQQGSVRYFASGREMTQEKELADMKRLHERLEYVRQIRCME